MQPSVGSAGFVLRWRAAAAGLIVPGAVLACAWTLYVVPFALKDSTRVPQVLLQSALGPTINAILLIIAIALVEAAGFRGRARTFGLVVVAMLTSALAIFTTFRIMAWSGLWSPSRWSLSVMWWGAFGYTAMIAVGAVIVEDGRKRSQLRRAALRDARLRAADVMRRIADVRLQAARARVEPRFLFDALSAVERVYDTDVAAGHRLLDDLVTYLRAVMPDLRETHADAGREAEIARLRQAIEQAIAPPSVIAG